MSRVFPIALCAAMFLVALTSLPQLGHAAPKPRKADREEPPARSALLIGGAALIDAGRFDQSLKVNRDVDDESDDVRDFSGGLVLGYLHGIGPKFRIGGSLMYSGLQRVSVVDANRDISFGQRLALDALAEGVIPVTEKMDIIVGGRLGTPILIPGGDFKDAVRVAQAQQFGTNAGPRFGLRLGVDVDVRIRLKEHFAIRAGAGYAWTRTWLMNSTAESELAFARRKYSLTLSQVRLGAGFEWLF